MRIQLFVGSGQINLEAPLVGRNFNENRYFDREGRGEILKLARARSLTIRPSPKLVSSVL